MEIVTAKKEDLEIVRKITRSTIKSIYPRYYPVGAVEFFLMHHSDEHIMTDISDGKVFLLFEHGVPVATVTVSANNINRLFVLPEFQHRGYGKTLLDFAEKKILQSYECVQIDASFPVRPEKGEKDGIMVYADPDTDVLMALQSHNSRSELWADLPAELPDSDVLITQRLILRRWEDSDAEDLYKYASDPDVGPIAGWPPHQSVDESRDVIKNVLSGKEAYAICLKEDGKAVGAIELKLNGHTDMTDRDDECEMGYWLGKPFWGQGIMPEAVKEMLRHAFEDCGMQKVWIGYYEGNTKSKRVQEKCGFKYQWRSENVDVPLMHEKRTGHVSLMTKEDWVELRRTMKRELGIARCGLACCLCSENVTCKGCKRDGFMELSWCKDAEWCEVRRCGIEKNLNGCYECTPAECRKGLYAEKIKPRAFAEFARRYGVEELLDCLERNEQAGIVYHREGIMGDYDDFEDLEELIDFIRTGKKE